MIRFDCDYTEGSYIVHKPKKLVEIEDYPEKFQFCKKRKSHYFKNEDSFTDLRVVILGDSSFDMHKYYLLLYFRELFFYWDHGSIDLDLIKWFKPDMIIELRVERFVDNIPYPKWIVNKDNVNLGTDKFRRADLQKYIKYFFKKIK